MKRFLIGSTLFLQALSSSPHDTVQTTNSMQEENKPKEIVLKHIKSNAFDADFLSKQVEIESSGNHIVNGELIESRAGALGIAQFMPSTWRWLKKKGYIPKYYDIANKKHQLDAQYIYMNYLYEYDYGIKYDKRVLAIAAYNAGPGRVKRLARKYGSNWIYHLPTETKDYLIKLRQT